MYSKLISKEFYNHLLRIVRKYRTRMKMPTMRMLTKYYLSNMKAVEFFYFLL